VCIKLTGEREPPKAEKVLEVNIQQFSRASARSKKRKKGFNSEMLSTEVLGTEVLSTEVLSTEVETLCSTVMTFSRSS
jgi:hypothetical protein